ncbi:chitinase [Streptomyces sp. NPDC127105]|uniref:chitinase n=1 Tax=Streptomyces sp. NPDC127105 TaxID=3345359 RepID=UPI003648E4A6
MRSFLTPVAGLACLVALAATGCSPMSDGTSDAAHKAGRPGTSYAPYVSATTASGTDSAGSPATYNLAFVISGGSGCAPEWDGMMGLDDAEVTSRIGKLRKSGATVRVSFGGAHGKELATTCENASALADAYGKALDAAGSTRADFDVEGRTLTDSASVDLRSRAIALLQKRRPGLEVSFTLPVMPSGLGAHGLALLESANEHDVQVSTVNLMTMNYAESYTGDMGAYALAAAKATHTQLKKVFGLSDAGAWEGMALTPMIGANDIAGETFTLADAARVRSFAEEKRIAWVSMWSTFRDRQCEKDVPSRDDAATDCSGVKQKPGAFARVLAG